MSAPPPCRVRPSAPPAMLSIPRAPAGWSSWSCWSYRRARLGTVTWGAVAPRTRRRTAPSHTGRAVLPAAGPGTQPRRDTVVTTEQISGPAGVAGERGIAWPRPAGPPGPAGLPGAMGEPGAAGVPGQADLPAATEPAARTAATGRMARRDRPVRRAPGRAGGGQGETGKPPPASPSPRARYPQLHSRRRLPR